jgi:hypothetical protein
VSRSIILAGLAALLSILVSAYAKTYSRGALGWCIAIVSPQFLLVAWRDWFGDTYWPQASVTLALVTGVAFGGLVLFRLLPRADQPIAQKELSPTQFAEFTRLIQQYHVAINIATKGQFDKPSRAALKVEMRRVSQWLKVNLGDPHHTLFQTASPVMETYTAVPADRMAFWQVAVGQLRYLQRLCEEMTK